MSMLQWTRKKNSQDIIIFVHGLKGGSESWSFDEKTSFPVLISQDSDLDGFDLACFEYFTNFTNSYGKARSLFGRLFGKSNKREINLPVDELSELLITEIDVNLSEYENIIFIAHSMGGLVTKSCILKMIHHGRSNNIKGFISLAVPHAGAEIASFTSMITENLQIKDLSVFSKESDNLYREWLQSVNLPQAKYIYGTNDNIVVKQSALPVQVLAKDSVAVHEDHRSICKPQDHESNVYKLVKRFVIDIISTENSVSLSQDFEGDERYDNEYFVLKMIIADVHNDITDHAKEYYFNAELARNFFTNDHDREILNKIYRKIKNIYQTQYEQAIANHLSANQLLASIHQQIDLEDKTNLSTLLANFDNLHKKGMIHQLANKLNREVIWSPDTTVESLDKLRSSK